jgi:hypothetical protein
LKEELEVASAVLTALETAQRVPDDEVGPFVRFVRKYLLASH